MTDRTPNPDPEPDPGPAPGPQPGRTGRGPRPEETPPAEGGTSFTGPDESHNPTTGWAAGPLTALAVVVVLVAAFFLTYAVWIWSR